MKKLYLSYTQRIVNDILLSVLFIALTAILIYSSSAIKTTSTLVYKEESNVDYKVFLKENDFYPEKYLEKDLQYVASLIDFIEVQFVYNYQMNEKVDYNYKYRIDGVLLIYDKNNKDRPVFQKSIELLKDNENEVKDNKAFAILESLRINYDEYNDLVRTFISEYSIFAESKLKLNLIIDVTAKSDNFANPVSSNSVMEMEIPLSEKTLNVAMNYNEINNSDIFKETSTSKPLNYAFLGFGIATGSMGILFVILTITLIVQSNGTKSPYRKFVDRILNSYDRVIVKLKRPIDINENELLIDIENFEELLDASDKLELPILYMEINSEKCWFIVRNGNEIYRYIVKSVDLESAKTNKDDNKVRREVQKITASTSTFNEEGEHITRNRKKTKKANKN